ncbi:MAG: DNA-directed RNA polymerase subunit alpha, partial [Candidatus Ryanbacteria bacterium RIFCSPLOWO2_02_FULL_45_11c]
MEGVFEIDGFYPGYGITVGNVLRRILLSSLPGAAITQVKIEGVQHEFSTISGIQEDVITILLNLKKIRFQMHTNEPQRLQLSVKGEQIITGKNLETSSVLEVANKDAHIATLTDKQAKLNMELIVETGLGYIPREVGRREKVEVGMMTIDALFSPVNHVRYEVENMRVGEHTNYNRLRLSIGTDGTITPEEAFEKSAKIAVEQFSALAEGFATEEELTREREVETYVLAGENAPQTRDGESNGEDETDFTKTKIEDLRLPSRTIHVLHEHGIKTVGGLLRRDAEALSKIPGIGEKAILEV